MGKSPGKWIKTVLFGKKSSKSNISKAREKLVKQKEGPIASKASEAEFSFDPTPITFARNERDPGLENKDPENLMQPNQVDIAGPDHQDATPDPDRIMQEEAATRVQATSPADPEKIKQEEAATRVQATLPADPEKIKQEEAATMVQATLPADLEKIKQEEAATMMHATLPADLVKIKKEEAVMKVQGTLPPDIDKIKQEEAAMKVQATFRGYLARRAFRSLKGIIRLQAHIRGHLVRRQAVSTLCCMYGIIKLQALIRGQRVRKSDVGCEMHEKFNLVKPLVDKCGNSAGLTAKIAITSANMFIHKLLASSTATTVLRLQYGSGNPNSVPSWLERWSASLFWKPVPKPKKLRDSRSQRKLGNISNGDAQMSKPKRGNWKIPSTSSDLVLVQENSEFNKSNRSVRKVSSKHTDPVQENSENEFEKVKRNLRKVHTPVVVNSAQSEVESETVKQHSEKVAVTSGYGVSEEEVKSCTNEKTKMDETLAMSNELDGVTLRISVSKDSSNLPGTQVPIISVPLRENKNRCKNNSGEEATKELKDSRGSCNDEKSPVTNGHLSLEEDSTRNENQKYCRKSPVLAKQELVQDALQNNSPTPTLPSYMAATESAKAKLRAQGSPRLGQDSGGESSNSTRRHSLPSSNNSKISSHSPRTQRPAQAGVKGGHKSDRTVGSSRGGNGKLTQAEWRR